jgi:chemotaxis family two-component system response regulator Rcp1
VLAKSKRDLHANVASDGAEAISFLHRQGKHAEAPSPDLVVLDLNLPRKDGREVLSDLKTDPALAKIPVVIFTSSQSNSDITRCYELGANCYLRKPGNLPDFVAVVQSMADFWLGFVSLPQKEKR